MPDNAVGINNQSGGYGQRPGVIAVVLGDIQAKLFVDRNEFFGHLVFQAILIGNFIAGIAENIHVQTFGFGDGRIVFRQLGG